MVAQFGPIFTFYVEPAQAKNKEIDAEIVLDVFERIGDERPFQLDFFDDAAQNPKARKCTPSARIIERDSISIRRMA